MSKTTPEAGRATGSRLWRGMAIIALLVLSASLLAALLWFFAEPLRLSPEMLAILNQRAGVAGLFTGMLLGTAGLVVAVVALRAQTRADRIPAGIAPPGTAAAGRQALRVAAEGRRPALAPADVPDARAPRPGDTDEPPTGTGKYVVDLGHAQGVQVGEHLTQHNVFPSPNHPA
ncbi:hypothetical protein Sme01_56860 [Sphaerisporangium melleum]|uniref:Uncharacterized protein n=1 Tax=Sphaerisporangium melleum TaxID=321316 RepID=A0A917VLV7_9ACTN|nr:hypothetical protein [Sphaerisporangium melleum]GGK94163.1 hypothetical protein GCM10007964_40740 [Sphaerisporangium melleum]GII73210.1 hypothetical protein Sme01_56860 [Sphaerisporangium melleum]